jgi:hypothetical protein
MSEVPPVATIRTQATVPVGLPEAVARIGVPFAPSAGVLRLSR